MANQKTKTSWPKKGIYLVCLAMFVLGAGLQPTCIPMQFQSAFPAYGSILVVCRTVIAGIRREQGSDWAIYLALLVTSPLWAFYLQRLCEHIF
jgi:hypothetical protein